MSKYEYVIQTDDPEIVIQFWDLLQRIPDATGTTISILGPDMFDQMKAAFDLKPAYQVPSEN